jgi:hypothetical protein
MVSPWETVGLPRTLFDFESQGSLRTFANLTFDSGGNISTFMHPETVSARQGRKPNVGIENLHSVTEFLSFVMVEWAVGIARLNILDLFFPTEI